MGVNVGAGYNAHMHDFLTRLSRRRFPYEPLITVEISRKRLLDNLDAFRKAAHQASPDLAVAPVLKSNAYGHGLFEVAEILEEAGKRAAMYGTGQTNGGISFMVVDSYFEAVALRASGIRTRLLIIGYTRPETIAHSRLSRTAFTVTSLETLRRLHPGAPPCPEAVNGGPHQECSIPRFSRVAIHLKIDTGMRRQGILPEEMDQAIALIKENDGLILDGACTHFSDTDDEDGSFTEGQISVWNRSVKHIRAAFPDLRYAHAAATDGVRLSTDIDANVVRLGIGLYGLSDERSLGIASMLGISAARAEPVMEVKTILTAVKPLRNGEGVGYGNAFKAMADMTIATIPFGYYEGLDRRISSGPKNKSRGFIHVGPERIVCPIIGRISMNIATIDVSALPGAAIGMEAVVVSRNPSDPNSIGSIARACATIPYDIAAKIPAHLKRVVVE